MTTILYFSWIREAMDCGSEDVLLPDTVSTVNEFLDWLAIQRPAFGRVLEDRDQIRVAVNQEYVDHGDKLPGASEIAIFPPVTGG